MKKKNYEYLQVWLKEFSSELHCGLLYMEAINLLPLGWYGTAHCCLVIVSVTQQ